MPDSESNWSFSVVYFERNVKKMLDLLCFQHTCVKNLQYYTLLNRYPKTLNTYCRVFIALGHTVYEQCNLRNVIILITQAEQGSVSENFSKHCTSVMDCQIFMGQIDICILYIQYCTLIL